MKHVVVAKLVHQTSDFYADAMKLLQMGSIREIWPKVQSQQVAPKLHVVTWTRTSLRVGHVLLCCAQDWVSNVAGKQAAYHALAEYHQAMVAKEKKEFGEEIARLTVSTRTRFAVSTRCKTFPLHLK